MFLLGSLGCDRAATAKATSEAPFESVFAKVSLITLEEPDGSPIARLAGADMDAQQRIVVADPSDATVKLFESTGRLLKILGRRGEGPGEFQLPASVKFDVGGRIHVADFRLHKVAIFSKDGELLREARLDVEVPKPMSMAVLRDGGYVFTAAPMDEARDVLFQVDSLGKLQRSYLAIAALRPRNAPESTLWATMRRFTAAVAGDTAYLAAGVSDSVWSVDLARGGHHSEQVPVPGYRAPKLPSPEPKAGPAIFQWARSQTTAATVFAADSLVVLPFVTGGIYHEGASNVLMIRRGGSGWTAIRDAPPVIGLTRDGDLLAIMSSPWLDKSDSTSLAQTASPYTIGVYHVK